MPSLCNRRGRSACAGGPVVVEAVPIRQTVARGAELAEVHLAEAKHGELLDPIAGGVPLSHELILVRDAVTQGANADGQPVAVGGTSAGEGHEQHRSDAANAHDGTGRHRTGSCCEGCCFRRHGERDDPRPGTDHRRRYFTTASKPDEARLGESKLRLSPLFNLDEARLGESSYDYLRRG